ncbi:Zn-dependent alcohol dehydrogenase [Lactobacillus nasalidis]|uniref:Zn-dependent alcohol dehydrogenase n=1 Tax=Lactobacillus nasalidis TaxID=2797258 RepID=A0ABQ3W4B8_9LACO|nr:alcohol dehydrogenase catalytic domain-containing protein [Lactobacillus nasalidis]GHV98515.1 Zn-dependent alcohol dehydrogenase [Lactobacillus nasalidis]GHW00010.1 Zn-dependent alcohol dehydrogenase [Lactobacillus nasalidis]GHW00342.1 Zn-dependent alcohol dehydrogenase [Lactobacillus nasalidis]
MKAAYFVKKGLVEAREVEDDKLEKETDAIIRVIRACVCGSDLWWFRGVSNRPAGTVGHEAIGIVEAVGAKVDNVKVGDFVIAPFTHGCMKCKICKAGFDSNCPNFDYGDFKGYQAEKLLFQNASALVKIPGKPSDYTEDQLKDFLTLADVMATGYHAAASAEVKPGDTAAVIGDGAVGLCGVIAAKLRGAKKIILLSHHEGRAALGREFGATDIVSERGEDAVKKVLELTDGYGADAVLECVGASSSIDQAGKIARAGAVVGRVGVPQKEPETNKFFWKNVGWRGGSANVTSYDREVLLDAVLKGEIHPGKVFTKSFHLDHVQEAYEAMDQREAIKSMLVVADK